MKWFAPSSSLTNKWQVNKAPSLGEACNYLWKIIKQPRRSACVSLYEALKSVHGGELLPAGSKETTAAVFLLFCRGKVKGVPSPVPLSSPTAPDEPPGTSVSCQTTVGYHVPVWLSSSIFKTEKVPLLFPPAQLSPAFGIWYTLQASRIHNFLLGGAFFIPLSGLGKLLAQLCAVAPGLVSMEDAGV